MRTRFPALLGAVGALSLRLCLFAQPESAAPHGVALDAAVEELLSRMTLAEKLGQMSQASRQPYTDHLRDTKELVRQGALGSILNATTREQVEEFQRIAVG